MLYESPKFLLLAVAFSLAVAWCGQSFGQTLAICTQKTQAAQKNCDGMASAAEAAKTSAANSMSSTSIFGGATGMSGIHSGASDADSQVKTACSPDKVKSECDTPCDSIPETDPTHAAGQKLSDACDNDLNQNYNKYSGSQADNTGNGQKSDQTASSAPAMPAMPSSSPSSPSTTPDTSAQTASTALTNTNTNAATTTVAAATPTPTAAGFVSTADCSSVAGASSEACASVLAANCYGKYSNSAVCSAFSARYCGSGGASGEASSGASQTGEGLGTGYCNSYTAANSSFTCSSTTSSCPSCGGTSTDSSVCGSDPAYTNPSVASSGGGGGGGGSSGGSGGSMALAAALDQKLADTVKKIDSAASGTLAGGSLGVSEGGGGGGAKSSASDFGFDVNSIAAKIASGSAGKRGPASESGAVVASASDIEKQKGASLFQISSDVLQNRCKSGRLLHCSTPTK